MSAAFLLGFDFTAGAFVAFFTFHLTFNFIRWLADYVADKTIQET